ncbi:hypothetical protein EXW96_18190 [Paenibacillus sp. JMULE4]|uniref:Uncharacterized protein n=1 Tax=Paenibacillus validus TaxID=44253 RepID=A0A7X2Z9K6_9BACL|nr:MULTISPECIES: hypothetical protein [Paenibacillus]MUG70772.1 hypothetical protein [Paenibacillus validus]NTZ19428.1 hypothetical protein [Paenibacillus sp. JMULE4]
MKKADSGISDDFIIQLEKEIICLEKELNDVPDNAYLKGKMDGLRRALLIYRMLLRSKYNSHPVSIEID